MALTFHSFLKLPYELREQIWQLAIRPAEYTGGIHYIFMAHEDMQSNVDEERFMTLCEWHETVWDNHHRGPSEAYKFEEKYVAKLALPQTETLPSSTLSKQSACFWDAGLWSACQESRAIMKKESPVPPSPIRRRASYTFTKTPLDLCVESKIQNWRRSVNSQDDLFCYTFHGKKSPIAGLGHSDQFMDFLADPFLFAHVRHIAVEFDESWNDTDWPEQPEDIVREDSPRGTVAAMFAYSRKHPFADYIWLIDHKEEPNEYWKDESDEYAEYRRRFFDMNQGIEYAETWNASEAFEFISRVEGVMGQVDTDDEWECESVGRSDDYLWPTALRVLKRRKVKS